MSNQSFYNRSLCQASTGSMTLAIKARRALSREGIDVSVKKLSAGVERRGCVYGIEFPCELSGNIFSVLRREGIDAEHYYR